jgi:hypothetical protein
MLTEQAAAILALLGTNTNLAQIFDGKVPTGATPPYVLVYVALDRPDTALANPLTGTSAQSTLRIYAHCVGATAAAARVVQDQVEATLLDVRPTVSGRVCGRLRLDEALPPDKDESIGTLVMDAVSVYRLDSVPG